MYPAILAKDLDIITFGSVQSRDGDSYGQIFPWSLSAPGNGYCAGLGSEVHGAEGSSFAGAVVAGLMAYFLELLSCRLGLDYRQIRRGLCWVMSRVYRTSDSWLRRVCGMDWMRGKRQRGRFSGSIFPDSMLLFYLFFKIFLCAE